MWRDARYMAISEPLWSTAFEDGSIHAGVMRQVNMRLRDEATVNELMWHLAMFMAGLSPHFIPDKFTDDVWHGMLRNFVKALERQVCTGEMEHNVKYGDLVMMSLGTLQ